VHGQPDNIITHNNNYYILGKIRKYNIIIAVLPYGQYNITSIIVIGRNILYNFPNIKIGLIISISGGVLNDKYNIRLSNIIVNIFDNKKNGVS
jgi:hypothetical protein